MNALLAYKKEILVGSVLAVFAIAILTVVSSYYFPSSVKTASSNYCPIQPALPPPDVNPPVAGYTYLALYNTTNGELLGGSTEASCSLVGMMPEGPFRLSTNEAYLNMTSDPSLPCLLANGYGNAYYVNSTTKQLVLRSGVTFTDGCRQAYYKGQPITNGTRLPE